MAPKSKFDPNDPAIVAAIELFKSINLSQTKALETVRNPKTTAALQELIDRNSLTSKGLDEKQSNLILHLALQGSKQDQEKQDFIVAAIADGRLKTNDQVNGALLNSLPVAADDLTLYNTFSCHKVSRQQPTAYR